MRFQTATSLHAQELADLVNSAYRGEYSEQGWTTEASLLGGQRTDSKKLVEMMTTPQNQIEIAFNDDSQKIIGSVHLIQELPDTLYFGMLTVEPKLQALGLGKKMLEHLENIARGYQFKRIRFTVIPTRNELIAFYERRGYKATGQFEPFPENAIIIKSMISLNKNLNIKLVEKAVSDKSETLNFNINSDNTMGKLQNSNFENFNLNSSQLLVETIKLDDFIESGNPVPSLIKIDVEGAEEFVLKGAINLLEQFKPTLFIEIHSNEIGIKCYEILSKYYENIFVLETGKPPSFNEKDFCSYIAYN